MADEYLMDGVIRTTSVTISLDMDSLSIWPEVAERTQHRKRWRGKRMSIRRKIPDDLMGRMVAPLISDVIRYLWRRGEW